MCSGPQTRRSSLGSGNPVLTSWPSRFRPTSTVQSGQRGSNGKGWVRGRGWFLISVFFISKRFTLQKTFQKGLFDDYCTWQQTVYENTKSLTRKKSPVLRVGYSTQLYVGRRSLSKRKGNFTPRTNNPVETNVHCLWVDLDRIYVSLT